MLIELIIALVLGIAIGTLSGLTPGIHINLVSTILLGLSATLLTLTSPLILAVFIVSMAITHTFVDFVPTIYLGAPNEDSCLSVLPGHRLLLEGKGHYAILLTSIGGLIGLVIILVYTPAFILILPKIYPYAVRIMPIILILISVYTIFSDKNKKLHAAFIFLLAGFLGIATLNLDLKEPLLPLLSGLFGGSGLVISIFEKTRIPKQEVKTKERLFTSKNSFFKSIFASLISSPFTAFLPGLGASQSALIGKDVLGELDEKEFLFLIGAINLIVLGLSFVTFYSIQKTRTGAAVTISKLLPEPSIFNLLIILTVIIFSGFIAFLITIKLSKTFSKLISRINYSILSIIILGILTTFIIFFSGFIGVLVFIISTFLGISTVQLGVKRTNLMACLLLPTILYYLL